MRLEQLQVKGYKNISNISIDFSIFNGTTIIIGNNGSGKSNILEAISIIFASLYKNRHLTPDFEYSLLYDIKGHKVNISFNNGRYVIVVDGDILDKTTFAKRSDIYLPTRVIACYSGDNTRLWDIFSPYYFEYIRDVVNADAIPTLPMLYINKYNQEIALLVSFFYDFDAFQDLAIFCQEKLGIKTIENISMLINSKKIKGWKNNAIVQMVKNLCAIDDIQLLPDKISLSLNEFKEKLDYLQGDERNLFRYLYGATMPKNDKIITGIGLELEMQNGSHISFVDLSEGEKKSLLIKFILETIADEDSLILLDEPDSQIHISRKAELRNILQKYQNRENVWTTHSPTLAIAFDGNILGIATDDKGETTIIDKSKSDLVSSLTSNIWNAQQQNIFLSSNKPITLLVEGKTDKNHIEEAWKRLKTQYPNLDFDVFAMNSSEHIREVLIGLSCSEIEWKKKYIGLFDNDSAGNKDIANGFESEEKNKDIKHVKYKDSKPSKSFYAFLLPRGDFKDGFTIENCYPPQKYEEAYSIALNEKKGHFANLSIDKIAEDLKGKSKTILADKAQSYNDEDFEGFKPIFDLINKIAEL